MRFEAVELHRLLMPLKSPFRTSFGVQSERDVLLVRALGPDAEGWGECVALSTPAYSSEYVDAAHAVLRDHLVPRLLAATNVTGRTVAPLLRNVLGHRMAKAALETAVLDAELRRHDLSFAAYVGASRPAVECGVSVGIAETLDSLLHEVSGYLEEGYRRIKLKIEPGWDREPVRAVREAFGSELLLQVDANTAYDAATMDRLERLDEFDLILIEQPFDEEDLEQHVVLARRMRTAICLDESITSARAAAHAVGLGACSIVNIKAGRVGGYLEAVRIHDVCAALGVPVWCGGMLETGLGRAANVALAALPNFRYPGDTSASARFYEEDITEPLILHDGMLSVPTAPGMAGNLRREVLDRFTQTVELVTV